MDPMAVEVPVGLMQKEVLGVTHNLPAEERGPKLHRVVDFVLTAMAPFGLDDTLPQITL